MRCRTRQVSVAMNHGENPMATESNQTELEEWVEPLSNDDLEPSLPVGTSIVHESKGFVVQNRLRSIGGITEYVAAEIPTERDVLVREAHTPNSISRLEQELEVLRTAACPFLPVPLQFFSQNEQTFSVLAALPPKTLADLFRGNDAPFESVLRWMTQVSLGLSSLHEAGWAHRGIQPSAIRIDRPIQISDTHYLARIGDQATDIVHLGGYSPAESFDRNAVEAQCDIYGVGVILLEAATGHTPSEAGIELSMIRECHTIAGLPQVLYRCLGPAEQRFKTGRELHVALLQLSRRLSSPLIWECSGWTSVGMEPSRTTNQDAFAYLTVRLRQEDDDSTCVVSVVADGMGGMEGGETAAAAAIQTIQRSACRDLFEIDGIDDDNLNSRIGTWLHAANTAVVDALVSRNAKGGCTIVCAIARQQSLAVGYVGDCRAYLFRDDHLQLLTRDHSVVMSLVAQGQLQLTEVRQHPDRSQVTRSLGERPALPDYYVDSLQVMTSSPTLRVELGEIILLCSDGLWEPVDEAEITSILIDQRSSLPQAAKALVDRAIQLGGPDNATVVLMRLM